MPDHPIEVAVHGMSLGSLITGAGVWSAVVALVGIIWKSRVPMRKIKVDAEERLRNDLMTRVEKVEAQLETERNGRRDDRKELEAKIDRQRELYESKLDLERARHEAEEMLSRHKVRNLEQCLSAFLWMSEKRPDNIPDVVAEIRKMRSEQEAAEAAEKGAVAGAKIIAAGPTTIAA